MMSRRFKFRVVLIAVFYLFHALSPLLFSVENAQAEQSDAEANAGPADFNLSVVGRTLSLEPAPAKDGDPSPASSSRVLLKKKRAIPASSKDIIKKLSAHQAKFFDVETTLEVAIPAVRIPAGSPICSNGFPFYHSGASPPLSA